MNSLSVKYNTLLSGLILFTSVVFAQTKENPIFDQSPVRISEISSNSVHSDFGPAIVRDSLFFTTFNDKLLRKSDDILKKKEYYDLYKAEVDKQGDIIGNREPVEEFITQFNDGPVSWCPKTGELFITQNYTDQSIKPKPFQKMINRLRIIVAKSINGKWEQISDFPYNNPKYSVGHPTVTESGDTLVFSSDKPGGYGETDLYYSVRKNGKWENPVNMGSRINTKEKEEFAFITDSHFKGRYLIFASKGRPGNGGFDLYYTPYPSDFSQISHFDPPINTPSDDFAMTIPTDAQFGYLTSDRPGTGHDDIYKFTFKRVVIPEVKTRELYVYDKTSLRPIPGVKITSCETKSYLTDKKGKVAGLPCLETECQMNATAFGYPDETKILIACDKTSSEITRDTIWMNIKVNEKITLRNIYYDFDKWNILPDAAQELDRLVALMKENPGMKVELNAHTDDRGTEVYNMRLSQLRAQSAVDYIISRGIDQSRIKGTGYGKSQLIHKGIGGQKCTPEQNRENRRTEIYIPGFLRAEPVKQDKGDYSNGRANAPANYSSLKEHGSIFDLVPDGTKTQKDQKAPSASAKVPQPAKEQEVSATNIPAGDRTNYYLVLGSFQEESSAIKYAAQLKLQGYQAVVCSESAPFRVGIGYQRFSQAKNQLDAMKGIQQAWILKK